MSYYANAGKSVTQKADLKARFYVLEDIRLSLLSGIPLRDFPDKLGDKQ